MMDNLYRKILLILALIFIVNVGFSQSNQITIKFIGNCGLYMTDGALNVYVDFPYKSGAYNYMKYDKAELDNIKDNSIFIFTHRHADHYSKKLLKKLHAKAYGPWNESGIDKLNASLQDFSIQSFRTKHRFSFKHDSYLITWHNKKIFISGDTENADTIATVKGIDWAFVPYWILLDATEKKMKIDAKMFAIYHLYPNQKINIETPDRIVLLDKEDEVITVPY
jgi:L-ascorbate metabolism protein UlaG (beta-lactamase superfamily)